jgi:hypothetical protein
MLVTAIVDPAVRDEFDAWHRDVHLPAVLSIPGIAEGVRLRGPSEAPNYAALYIFSEGADLRTALGSSQAREARAGWERWDGHIRDLTVQFYAGFTPARPLYRQN